MKKISVVIFVFLLTFTMTACGKSHNSHNEKALFDLGIEVTKTMQEVVYSDEYISLYAAIEFEDEITPGKKIRIRGDFYKNKHPGMR